MLFFMFMMATALIFNTSTELQESLELVPFPTDDFQKKIMYSLISDGIVCYGIE